MSQPARILIVGPSWVGDMVMTQSLFKFLRMENPNVVIDVIAPAWSVPVLARMPEVNQAIVLNVGHGVFGYWQRYQLAKQLREVGYSQAIVIPRSFKSALVPWLAGIPKRTGWLGEHRYFLLNDVRKLDKNRYPMMIERLVALALPANAVLPKLPYPALQASSQQIANTMTELGLHNDKRPILILCPGAEFGTSKRWPIRHFAEVARWYLAQNWQVWILGSGKEKPLADEIQSLAGEDCWNFAGVSSLPQSIDLMAQATLVISNDSGLMHVAASFDKPLIGLFGASPQSYTPPLSSKAKILSLNLACSPCKKRICPLGHHACLEDLTPKMVIEAAASFNLESITSSRIDPRSHSHPSQYA